MKKRLIGVILSDATAEYPKNVLKGIMEQAELYDYNVAVFSTFIRFEGSIGHQIGETSIYQLINYDLMDGVIILPDSIRLKDALEDIKSNLREKCSCPIVCADLTEEIGHRVPTDEEEDFKRMVEHFIRVHKFTRINCLAGIKGSLPAELRLSGYKKALNENGILVEEDRIMYGDFWRDSGKVFVDNIMRNIDNLPEAIVCANDYMAITVCEELKSRGIRVPEDVCVSGYDNIGEGIFNHPSITTIKSPQKQIGLRAVDYIHRFYEKEEIDESVSFGELVLGESCGCSSHSYYGKDNLIQRINFEYVLNTMREEITELNLMGETLIGLDSVEEFMKRLNEKVYLIKNYQEFYLCLNDNWEGVHPSEVPLDDYKLRHNISLYSEDMKLMIAHRNERYIESNILFPRTAMLPQLFEQEERSKTYFFVPIHFESRTYGYAVVTYKDPLQIYDYDLRSWISNVSSSLEMLRIQNNLRWYHKQVENLAIKDALTGVYNRRGFERYSQTIFDNAKTEKKNLALFVIDLDNLKQINDTFGHQEGDNAILMVTEAFLKLPSDLGVLARTGGDEFVYIFKEEHKREEITEIKKRVQAKLREISIYNASGYIVTASIGTYYGVPTAEMTVSECHSMADKNMYYEKVRKKAFI